MNKDPRHIARINSHGHVASLSRDAFGIIADEPVFDDHQRSEGTAALTFRGLLEPNGPPTDVRQQVRFAAGLVGRVTTALTARGYEVQVGDQSIEPAATDQLRQQVQARVRRACARPRSLFIVPKLKKQIRFIAELHKLAPESHILVVAKNNQQAKEVAGMLAEATGREATWGSNQRFDYPWLHVKGVGSLAGDTANQWDIVIFLDAELAIATTAMGFLAAGDSTVRIGFLARNVHHRHEAERGALEGLFGPVDDHNEFAGGSVAWLQPRIFKFLPFNNIIERKRLQVWKNRARNHLIARAARALSAADIAALKMLGLHDSVSASLGHRCTQKPTVAIVAANREQGEELARLLPQWRLEDAGYVPRAGQLLRHDRFIATRSRAAEELVATSVIIFAAGGCNWWLEQIDLGITSEPEKTLIVDVADTYDATNVADVRSRAAGYRHYGYREEGSFNFPQPSVSDNAG